MGMTFTDIENKSAKRLISIAAVIFLHLLVAYILMSGLANNIQKPAEKPVELQIIQDIKPPPPPKPEEPKPKEKPPEPPKMVEKVAKVPEPVKQVEKVTPVQKTPRWLNQLKWLPQLLLHLVPHHQALLLHLPQWLLRRHQNQLV